MNEKNQCSKSGWPVAVTEAEDELTPKDEAVVTTLPPADEHRVKIEKKLEHEAVVANQLPQPEQLAEFEKKLEHDDAGNQPS